MGNDIRIEIDGRSGFCFGVVNAIGKAEKNLGAEELFSLGDIVHNRMEVQRLGKLGLRSVGHAELPSLEGKRLLIRAHGEPPATYRKAEELNIEVVDATCPVVAKLQQLVGKAYAEMQAAGGQVVILGKPGHAEVAGLSGHADGKAVIVEGIEDLEQVDFSKPLFFLSQTTQSLSLFEEMSREIMRRTADPAQVTIKDTICRQVANREGHLRDFAGRFDVVLFVSGRKSSNGRILFEVCRAANPRSHMVEEEGELLSEWFAGARSVGICGATSTPQWLMEDVAARTGDLVNLI